MADNWNNPDLTIWQELAGSLGCPLEEVRQMQEQERNHLLELMLHQRKENQKDMNLPQKQQVVSCKVAKGTEEKEGRTNMKRSAR